MFPYGPWSRWPMWSRPPDLPADVSDQLITASAQAIQDPRFKEFAKKNAFLVDDLTGDALTKEIDSVAGALGTVAAQVFKDQKE